MRLFVYGTLMRGERGHDLLGSSTFVTHATTPREFTLVDLGSYPGLRTGGETAVLGEIYEVSHDTLRDLDDYEEVPEVYLRISRMLAGAETMLYVLRPEIEPNAPAIQSGDWRKR